MATQKPISSISYNSEAFLKEKLDSWYKAHIIQAYMYVKHVGEDGDKNHIHFRVEPNKKLDPMDLQEDLKEYTLDSIKPLGCRPFRPSKEEDWILYAVHDKDYLKSKYQGGEKGEKIPYSWQDIVVSDGFDMEVAFVRAKSYMLHTSSSLTKRIQSGEDALKLLQEGENPYVVNAILRLLSGTDYQRIARENDDLQERLSELELALQNSKMKVVKDTDGCPFIVKIDK